MTASPASAASSSSEIQEDGGVFYFAVILTAVAGLVWQSFHRSLGVYSSSAGGDHTAGCQ